MKNQHPVALGRTDKGLARDVNEDSYLVEEIPGGQLLIVCDGMGGSGGGELAAQIGVNVIRETVVDGLSRDPDTNLFQLLWDALVAANRAVHERARGKPELAGMGTTAAVAVVQGGHAYLAHVGDSRIYLFKNGTLTRCTADHGAQTAVVNGDIADVPAEDHPAGAQQSPRALGLQPEIDPEVYGEALPLEKGDAVLLATDGLTDVVDDAEIEAALVSPGEEALDQLVEAAHGRGAPDNLSLALFQLSPPRKSLVELITKPKNAREKVLRNRIAAGTGAAVVLLVVSLVFAVSGGRDTAQPDAGSTVAAGGEDGLPAEDLSSDAEGVPEPETQVGLKIPTVEDFAARLKNRFAMGSPGESGGPEEAADAVPPEDRTGKLPIVTPVPVGEEVPVKPTVTREDPAVAGAGGKAAAADEYGAAGIDDEVAARPAEKKTAPRIGSKSCNSGMFKGAAAEKGDRFVRLLAEGRYAISRQDGGAALRALSKAARDLRSMPSACRKEWESLRTDTLKYQTALVRQLARNGKCGKAKARADETCQLLNLDPMDPGLVKALKPCGLDEDMAAGDVAAADDGAGSDDPDSDQPVAKKPKDKTKKKLAGEKGKKEKAAGQDKKGGKSKTARKDKKDGKSKTVKKDQASEPIAADDEE